MAMHHSPLVWNLPSMPKHIKYPGDSEWISMNQLSVFLLDCCQIRPPCDDHKVRPGPALPFNCSVLKIKKKKTSNSRRCLNTKLLMGLVSVEPVDCDKHDMSYWWCLHAPPCTHTTDVFLFVVHVWSPYIRLSVLAALTLNKCLAEYLHSRQAADPRAKTLRFIWGWDWKTFTHSW